MNAAKINYGNFINSILADIYCKIKSRAHTYTLVYKKNALRLAILNKDFDSRRSAEKQCAWPLNKLGIAQVVVIGKQLQLRSMS